MNDQYLLIQMEHLKEAWMRGKEVLELALPATMENDCFYFQAFGEICKLCQDSINLGGKPATGPVPHFLSHVAPGKRKLPGLATGTSFSAPGENFRRIQNFSSNA